MRVWPGGRGWQWKHGSQGPARMTLRTSGDFLGGSDGNDLSALVACVGAEIYDPVGGFHDVKVVLDDEDGVAGVHQSLEDFEEHAHIVEVQAGGRFVEEKEGGGRRGKAPIDCGVRNTECGVRRGTAWVGSYDCFGEVADQFQALAFSAGKGVDGLAEPEIAEAYFFQQPQAFHRALCRAGLGEAGQEGDCFFDGGFQQVGDGERAGFVERGARPP